MSPRAAKSIIESIKKSDVIRKPSLRGCISKISATSKPAKVESKSEKEKEVKFNWDDALNLEFQLKEDERKLRDKARQFGRDKLAPRIKGDFRNEDFDRAIIKEMGDLGFLGCELKGYGCSGASPVSMGLINREIERIDSGYRSSSSVHSSLVMFPIYTYGTEEQKEKYMVRLSKGEIIGSFALTEPNVGSDAAALETTCKHDKEKKVYTLNGCKKWISNAPEADIMVMWAKCVEEEKIRGFILERGMKGLETEAILGKYSLRASPTGMIFMENVEVPESQLLPKAVGLSAPMMCLNNARLGVAWGVMGAAEACLETVREYTLNRTQFNRPLASFQLIQKKMADMMTDISLGLQGCLQVSRLKEKGLATPEMVSLLKRNNCQKALDIARTARDMMGGNGIWDEYGIIRHVLNLEAVNTYEGTSDIHALILGKAITGISAFS